MILYRVILMTQDLLHIIKAHHLETSGLHPMISHLATMQGYLSTMFACELVYNDVASVLTTRLGSRGAYPNVCNLHNYNQTLINMLLN